MDVILVKYRDILVKAYKSNYVHGLSSGQAGEIFEVASKLGLRSGTYNCPACVLRTCEKLGKYILEQEEKEKKAEALRMTHETPKKENNKTNKEEKKETPDKKTKKNKK